MAAPIVVELASSASSAAGDPDLSRALIDACSAAAGAGGCVLDTHDPAEPRARVIVPFSGGDKNCVPRLQRILSLVSVRRTFTR